MFEKGATFFFSTHNPELIKRMVSGIQSDNIMFNGLEVAEVVLQEDPDFTERELFMPGDNQRQARDKTVCLECGIGKFNGDSVWGDNVIQ